MQAEIMVVVQLKTAAAVAATVTIIMLGMEAMDPHMGGLHLRMRNLHPDLLGLLPRLAPQGLIMNSRSHLYLMTEKNMTESDHHLPSKSKIMSKIDLQYHMENRPIMMQRERENPHLMWCKMTMMENGSDHCRLTVSKKTVLRCKSNHHHLIHVRMEDGNKGLLHLMTDMKIMKKNSPLPLTRDKIIMGSNHRCQMRDRNMITLPIKTRMTVLCFMGIA